jgi:cadmium resistance protein CadD (predicted permease)
MGIGATLEQLATAIGVASVVFTATNIDDVFILLALFSNPSFRASQIVAGQLSGMAALIALSIVGALLARAIAPGYVVGLLGLVPLALGVIQVFRRDQPVDDSASPAARSSMLRILAVAAITVANGGDNVGVYIPMFATANRIQLTAYAMTMLALTAGLSWLAHALIQHPRLGAPIHRFAATGTPFILIALGLYILIESRAYEILGSNAFEIGPGMSKLYERWIGEYARQSASVPRALSTCAASRAHS